MRSIPERLRVRGARLRLDRIDPAATPGCAGRQAAAARLQRNLDRIDALQYRLHAEGRRSLLLVLQGMDAAGKDGVIRRVMTAFNPQGCRAWSFKVPTAEEARHDFLWRIHAAAPGRGEVAIFNRSHYEDVLVVRVHGRIAKRECRRRLDAINDFERRLHENGTRVLKFFLHIGRDEQRDRLLARLDDPDKHWKFSAADVAERALWHDYRRAFEDALSHCSTDHAPWYVVPANHKWYRDLAVSEIVRAALEDMHPEPPRVEIDVKRLRARLTRD